MTPEPFYEAPDTAKKSLAVPETTMVNNIVGNLQMMATDRWNRGEKDMNKAKMRILENERRSMEATYNIQRDAGQLEPTDMQALVKRANLILTDLAGKGWPSFQMEVNVIDDIVKVTLVPVSVPAATPPVMPDPFPPKPPASSPPPKPPSSGTPPPSVDPPPGSPPSTPPAKPDPTPEEKEKEIDAKIRDFLQKQHIPAGWEVNKGIIRTTNSSKYMQFQNDVTEMPEGIKRMELSFESRNKFSRLPDSLEWITTATFNGATFKNLPQNFAAENLSLYACDQIEEITMKEVGSLHISACKNLKRLGGIRVGGNLIIAEQPHPLEFSPGLSVGKDLMIDFRQLEKLPNNLVVGGKIHVVGPTILAHSALEAFKKRMPVLGAKLEVEKPKLHLPNDIDVLSEALTKDVIPPFDLLLNSRSDLSTITDADVNKLEGKLQNLTLHGLLDNQTLRHPIIRRAQYLKISVDHILTGIPWTQPLNLKVIECSSDSEKFSVDTARKFVRELITAQWNGELRLKGREDVHEFEKAMKNMGMIKEVKTEEELCREFSNILPFSIKWNSFTSAPKELPDEQKDQDKKMRDFFSTSTSMTLNSHTLSADAICVQNGILYAPTLDTYLTHIAPKNVLELPSGIREIRARLDLFDNPQFIKLPDSLRRIEELNIIDCPNLISLPEKFAAREIYLRRCPALALPKEFSCDTLYAEDWGRKITDEELKTCASNVRKFVWVKKSQITNLPDDPDLNKKIKVKD